MEKLVVFVAAERDKSGKYSPILDVIEQNTENVILLHNQYNYANEKGSEILANFETEPPQHSHPWEQAMRQDFWGIKESDIVVLDLDSLSSVHFMAAAAMYHRPMIAVSETLISVPAYFSGSVDLIVKPDEVLNSIAYVLARQTEKAKAVAEAETKAKEEAAKDLKLREAIEDPKTSTKEKMQDILHRSMQKTLNKLDSAVVEGTAN